MAKSNGLGDNFYVGGYDLSGDISAIGQLGGGPALLDVTSIKDFANERIGGLRSGDWQFSSFFEFSPDATAPSVPDTTVDLVSTYNNAVLVTIAGGTITSVKVNGTEVGTTDGTYLLPALGKINLTYTGTPTWTWTAVGVEHNNLSLLPTSDTIATYFRGSTLQAPAASINGIQLNYDFTRDTTGNLTIATEVQSDKFGMEWGEQLTAGIRTDTAATVGSAITDAAASSFGAQAYVHLVGFVGTSVTVAIDHCATSGGSYTSLMSTTAMTDIGAQRLSIANDASVDQFLKIVTTGTFTYAAIIVNFARNSTAGIVF